MRIVLLLVLLCGFALPVHSQEIDRLAVLSEQYNAARQAGDLEGGKQILIEMLTVATERGFDFNGLLGIRMELVHLQIETDERAPVDAAYAELYAGAIAQEVVDEGLVARLADEWAGISTDWGVLDPLSQRAMSLDGPGYAPLHVRIGAAYRRDFDFVAADPHMQLAVAALEGTNPRFIEASALVQNDFAWRLYMLLGQYTEAQAELQLALSLISPILEFERTQLLAATITHNLAESTLNLGEREEAARLARAAMASRERILGPDDPKVAESAVLAARAVDSGPEEGELLQRALIIYNSDPRTYSLRDEALILRAGLFRRNNLLKEANGDLQIAYDDFGVREAIQNLRAPRPAYMATMIGRILAERSAIRAVEGDAQGAYVDSLLAEEFFSQADGSNTPAPEDPNLFGEWQSKASIENVYQKLATSQRAIENDNRDYAVESAFKAVAIASTKLISGRRYHLRLGGQYRPSRENFANYRDLADQFIAAEFNQTDPEEKAKWLEHSFRVFNGVTFSSTSSAVGMVSARSLPDAAQSATARLFFDSVGELRSVTDSWRAAATARLGLATPGPVEAVAFGFVGRYSSVLAATEQYDRELGEASVDLAETNLMSTEYYPETLRTLLSEDEAIVGFYCNDSLGAAWVLRQDGPSVHRLAASCATVRELTQILRVNAGVGDVRGPTPVADRDRAQAARVVDAAYAAYRALLAPIAAEIEAHRHLIIVPTGDFIGVPWSMLVTAPPSTDADRPYAEAAWLARRHAVSILPSVAAFHTLRTATARASAPLPYLGVADPLLGGTAGVEGAPPPQLDNFFRGGVTDLASLRQLPALPETAAEIAAVALTLEAGADAQLTGAAATETALKGLADAGTLRDYRVLHFATHGLIAGELDGLAEPALVLSPPATASDGDDGLLTASEISTLDLNADWAILSACNTAAGASASAEPLTGLARAFLYAGARALVVSQWPVESKSAVELVTSTFEYAAQMEQVDRAEALRLAMLELIEGGTDDPALWAPFFVIGD
jgi:CHAT domain-containing protein